MSGFNSYETERVLSAPTGSRRSAWIILALLAAIVLPVMFMLPMSAWPLFLLAVPVLVVAPSLLGALGLHLAARFEGHR